MAIITSQKSFTLVDILSRWAYAQPTKVLYTFLKNGQEVLHCFTYQQFLTHVENITQFINRHALPSERALLLYHYPQDFIGAFLACLKAGIIAIPIHLPQSYKTDASVVINIFSDAKPSLFLTSQHTLSYLNAHPVLKTYTSQTKTLLTDSFTVFDTSQKNKASKEMPLLFADIQPLGFLQYTSGSTAMPKGVMITHQNILHNQSLIQKNFQTDSNDIIISWLPFYHDMGLIGSLLHPLFIGGSAVIMSPMAFLQKPARWLEAISIFKGTVSGGPDFAYALCTQRIDLSECQEMNLGHWRIAFNGAEKVRAQTLKNFTCKFSARGFQKKSFYPTYGLAEATLFVAGGCANSLPLGITVQKESLETCHITIAQKNSTTSLGLPENLIKLVSVGKPHSNSKAIIVDTENFSLCPEHHIGEIWLSGPSIAAGYWEQTSLNHSIFNAYLCTNEGPFLRTGDLGFYHHGNLFITGRLKDLIILHGRNIYPEDIEFEIQQSFPSLKKNSGAVFSVDDKNDGERIVFVQEIERRPLISLDDRIFIDISRHIGKIFNLPVEAISLMKPFTLPKTSSGKIRRHYIKSLFLTEKLDPLKTWFLSKNSQNNFIFSRPEKNHAKKT